MQKLAKLFGNASKVKIMRFFLFHPNTLFDSEDIAVKTNTKTSSVRSITNMLEKIGFLKKKTFTKTIEQKTQSQKKTTKAKKTNARTRKTKKKRVKGWVLNQEFEYLSSLSRLLVNTKPFSHKDIITKLKRVGQVQFIAISGAFIQEWDSRIDILVVGDRIKKSTIAKIMHAMESEIGKEIKYTFFTPREFMYRLNVYDKLLRDVFDYPYEIVFDKTDFSSSVHELAA